VKPRWAALPLLLLTACIHAPVPPVDPGPDAEHLRAWMDHNLAGVRTARISARVHLDSALGQGQVRLDGDWQQDRGLRLILRSPLGTELARLDSGGAGLVLSDTRLGPLLTLLDSSILGDLLSGELEEQGRLGLLLWGDLRPGRDARFRPAAGTQPAGFASGDTLWHVEPELGLCDRLEWPGITMELDRFQRVGPRWQPRLLRLVETGMAGTSRQSVIVEYLELELRH
jgi:hypothetical protein